jgi:D-alanyl-D-alanine carboxypeptidase
LITSQSSAVLRSPPTSTGSHRETSCPPRRSPHHRLLDARRPHRRIERCRLGGVGLPASTVDAETGRQIPPDAHFHAGSIAKTFETVVILQLAAEGRIDLDQTVQFYLPGLLPGAFAPITVRQLINFTSGLPDVDEGAPAASADQIIATRSSYRTFDQVIQETLRPTGRPWPGPHFAPGTEQEYNSLGFRIGGALIEQITGHSYKQELTARVLRPLHLTQTSVPGNDPVMPRPYLHGYMTDV